MNPWAARRKGAIFAVVFLSLLILIGVPTYYVTRNTPVCNNGLQDGDETGVDCGGSCRLLCTPETLPLISRGDVRILKIATSTYVSTILIENPNVNGSIKRAPYTISIYSASERQPVKVFERETYVGRNSTFALYEGPFELTGSGPFRAVFSWGDNLGWEKSKEYVPIIGVENMNFINPSLNTPRLEATLVNRGEREALNIEAVALLSDKDGNTIGASKTFVDSLASGESTSISFSWPSTFSSDPVSIRILPHSLPDKSFIR